MKYIEAVEKVDQDLPRPLVFLAGGITDCPEWQWEIADKLDDYSYGTLINPRRKDFPINNPDAAEKQIAWEHNALWMSDIFSIWFCNSSSVQPICMFELGAHLSRFYMGDDLDIVIGIEPGYAREQDVRIQTSLIDENLAKWITTSLDDHAKEIKRACESYRLQP